MAGQGTNLSSAVQPISTTLWIRETEPTPTGTGDILLAMSAFCTGTPPTTTNTFKHGCTITQLDTSSGTASLYENTGTASSVVWTLIGTSNPGTIALTNTHVLVGNASNVATDVPMTGDASITAAGVLRNSRLSDTNGLAAVTVGTTASAVNNVIVTNAATANGPSVASTGTDTNIAITVAGKGTGAVLLGQATSTGVELVADQPLVDSSGNTYIAFVKTASAVNGLTVTNSATNNPPTLTATGTDSKISFNIAPKGTGGMTLGSATGTSDMIVGSSSGAQSVKLANGAGAPTVNVANVSTSGATVTIAGAATAGTNVDTLNIATGNAAATAKKIVNIATGTPNTSGNNQVTIGGGATSAVTVNATMSSYQAVNYIATESGANNAIVATLTNAAGANITVATGLRVVVQLAHTLQAGANTFNLNGHGTDSIKKHTNAATDLGTAYASTGVIDLFFNGTVWLDMSQ